ncbi:Acyltransferase [Frankia sp. AiPs1]|uniref:2-oxo acid dehydrogenase subunit E2 n=1 Tax=Frankia sp. AiPa1 TaxID=573492 RepID=UPI00202ADDFF|nr:2-oxo acid dehydrogenase subunit E2 [Frankia sp. AiPa1]MCL9762947.1 2-oxo acid dehydrogenase subunit E2 [Frankia sp. AiPa1]
MSRRRLPRPASAHGEPIARERRHTLFFLNEIRAFAPVFLDTEVDMTAVLAHRAAALAAGRRYSLVSYVLWSAARVLVRHPEANAAIRGRLRPRVQRHPFANGKITLDRTLGERRIVLSFVLRNLHRATIDDVQSQLDHLREGDPERMREFAGARALHQPRLPVALYRFRQAARPLPKRAYVMGTFAVTSLGHRAVDGFHSVGGTTVTLGVGRVLERPVVRAGAVEVAPLLRLNLAFDHRVIDGAEAADVLTEVRDLLEAFPADAGVRVAPPLGARAR